MRNRVKDFAECLGVDLGTSIPQVEKPIRQWIHHRLVLTGAVVINIGNPNRLEVLVWLLHVLRRKQAQVFSEKLSPKGSRKS